MSFPSTKYMGSKQAILPFIMEIMSRLEFETVLDAFSGSGCVSYALKKTGKTVHSNDFLDFCYHISNATVSNNHEQVKDDEIKQILSPNKNAKYFIRKTFEGLYFSNEDNKFLDNSYANISLLRNEYKKSLALSALCRACMKKRPRGIFTFTGKKGWDKRKDLKLSMQEQFLIAISEFNNAVFSNEKENRSTSLNVFDIDPNGIDLVYIDTPYVSPLSDCDYTRRYHFVEGLCSYWSKYDIQHDTRTKKIPSKPTIFKSIKDVEDAFYSLFKHFKDSKLVISYSSNCIPKKSDMTKILKEFKKRVCVYSISHKYCFGNHKHKVGSNNNDVEEYLFVAE